MLTFCELIQGLINSAHFASQRGSGGVKPFNNAETDKKSPPRDAYRITA